MIEYPNMKPSELAEAMGAEFLKLMEAHFPMLCQLERQVADPHSDSDNPAVAMLGDHGAAWGQLLPKGVRDGQCLVWAQGDGGGRWEAGAGASGAYDGEFALSLVEHGNTTKLRVAGGRIYVNDEAYPVSGTDQSSDFSLSGSVTVYLVVRETPNGDKPYAVTLETGHANNPKAYVEIGTCAQENDAWTITQKYLGGSGLAFGFSEPLPPGTTEGQVLRWNNNAKKWEAGWVTAI